MADRKYGQDTSGGNDMFRSFCVGALAGFLFGSSKKGQDMRDGLDGFLTELTSGDAIKALDDKRNELTELASNTFSKFTGGEENKAKSEEDKSGKEKSDKTKFAKNRADEQNFEPKSDDFDLDKDELEDAGKPIQAADDEPLDADKAQELADKLGAKPSAPEDENLAAFHHDDELKSA